MHQLGFFFLPSHVRTKIPFLIDTVPPNAKDAETRGHDPLPPSPLMQKLQLMAEEVANYKSILCQATNCWMPNAECDSSHLCRGHSCGVRLHGTCGFVDVNDNPDGNEMLRVCGRPSCIAGKVMSVTAISTSGGKRKCDTESTPPKRKSPPPHAHTCTTSLVSPLMKIVLYNLPLPTFECVSKLLQQSHRRRNVSRHSPQYQSWKTQPQLQR